MIILGILCTSYLYVDKSGKKVYYALCLETLELYLNLIEALCYGPEFREQINNHDKAGGNSYSSF